MQGYNLPSGFLFDARGLVREKDGAIIANFFLEPTKSYRQPGEVLPSFCDIAVVRDGKRIPFQSRVRLSALSPAWWKKTPPSCCYSPGARAPHRQMSTLFQMLLGNLEPVTIFRPEVLGWGMLPTGEHVYVTGDGAIGANGYLPKDQIWLPDTIERYRLETLPSASEEDAVQYFWRLYRALPGITDTLLVNAFAAILYPCFKKAGIEARFPIILEGPSESKKTTLACLTSCLYNRKSGLRNSIATLTSTNRALEKRGVELRHTVQIFDDLFPDGGGVLEQKALELIRNIANQIPRQSCSGKTLEGAAMECGAVITAEVFLNCGRSTRTRCLRLVLNSSIPNNLLLPLQEHPELLGNVFQKFIVRTAMDFEEVTRKISVDFQEYRNMRAQHTSGQVSSERLYEIGFILYTALKVFLEREYKPDSSITQEELSSFQSRLNWWINWQLSPQAVPGRGWLVVAIAELAKRFPNEFYRRPGYMCIQPERLCSLLQKYCRNEAITILDITRQLRSEQLLSMDKSKASTKKIKGLGRCLYINTQRLLQ